MHTTSVQGALFQKIREQAKDPATLAETIAGLLHVSNDSAYRRIRGETPLVLDEVKLLCNHFHISADALFGQTGSNDLNFTLFPAVTPQRSFEDFLGDIKQHLQHISSFKRHELIYLTKDIPIFHQLTFQPLYAFRYFFWMKSIVQHPDYIHQRFSCSCLPASTLALGSEILELYNRIPSTEIWNTECVTSVLLQLEFYRQSEFFASAQDLMAVYEALEQTIHHLATQTAYGCKFRPGEKPDVRQENFHFYSNRIVLGDNTILVMMDDHKVTYINHDVLDYMLTSDARFCDDTHQKLRNLIRRSTLISKVSEKQRTQFFSVLLNKLARSKAATLSNAFAG